MDKNMSELLRWGIENTSTTPNGESTPQKSPEESRRNADILASMFSGPSEADLMKGAMAAIKSSEVDLENKLIAFDNFEQMVENIDNANNIEALKLWDPLLKELENEEGELRAMAAWCIGTAVQNNEKAQEKAVNYGAIPTLTKLAVEDPSHGVRKKAILALSSAIRNHQPAFDQAAAGLPEEHKPTSSDSTDMESIDALIKGLRDASTKKG